MGAIVLTRANLKDLIDDVNIRAKMRSLVDCANALGLVVRLQDARFEVDDGAVGEQQTADGIPLTDQAVLSVKKVLDMLRLSLSTYAATSSASANPACRDMQKLIDRRKATRAVTEKYYVAAAETACDMDSMFGIIGRAAAIGNKIDISCRDGDKKVLGYARKSEEYPFDPLTAPHIMGSSLGSQYQYLDFVIPDQWRLLVALVMYDEDQYREEEAQLNS